MRCRAPSSALAGDLLEDLESDRLDERDVARRIAAFGLDPARSYAALVAVPARSREPASASARLVAAELDTRGVRYVSATRLDRAAFLLEARAEEDALALARAVVAAAPGGPHRRRPARARPRRSAGACSRRAPRSTPARARSRPTATSGRSSSCSGCPTRRSRRSSTASSARPPAGGPLSNRCARCSTQAAAGARPPRTLGVHRHTLRYRMERLRERTGRHPDNPSQRMELWLAVKASEALAARARAPADT